MARTRTIDADELIQHLTMMPIYVATGSSYYGASPDINQAVDMKIQQALQTSLITFRDNIIAAVSDSAVLHGPCLLCAPKEGDCQPPKLY